MLSDTSNVIYLQARLCTRRHAGAACGDAGLPSDRSMPLCVHMSISYFF